MKTYLNIKPELFVKYLIFLLRQSKSAKKFNATFQ